MKQTFEKHFNGYTIDLIRHLVKTEQAKNHVVNLISDVMRVTKEDALKFYKQYREFINEKQI